MKPVVMAMVMVMVTVVDAAKEEEEEEEEKGRQEEGRASVQSVAAGTEPHLAMVSMVATRDMVKTLTVV